MPLLPPAELVRPCPALPKLALKTTGDLLNDDQGVRASYKTCAAKVQGVATWRAQHAGVAK